MDNIHITCKATAANV